MEHANHKIEELFKGQSFCETCGVLVDHDFVNEVAVTYLLGVYRPLNSDGSQKQTKYWIQWNGEEIEPEMVKTLLPEFYAQTW